MPSLGSHLAFNQLEARNMRIHQLSAAPSSPVTGQMYYDTVANSLYWYNGTAWISASGGTPADATAGSKGVVQLAGDLSGTAAAPTIATGAITSAKIADGTITDVDVASANKDGVTGTASMRTIGYGAQQSMPGNRTLSDISANNASVSAISASTQRITNVLDPAAAQDAATKNYVDNVAAGLDAKQSVRCASTANLGLTGLAAIDGVTPIAGDRVLAKDQTAQSANGIYIAASGAWTRATDADAWTELPGAYTWVEQGAVNADTGWVCTADQGGTLGTTNIAWVQFSGAAMITAGAGITKTGNTLSANVDGTTIDAAGSGTSLEVKAGGVGATQLAVGAINLGTSGVITGTLPIGLGGTSGNTQTAARTNLNATGYYNNAATHGAGTTITITAGTHNLGAKRGIHVQVQDNTTGNVELPDISVAATGDVTVTYAASVSANSKLVTLVG